LPGGGAAAVWPAPERPVLSAAFDVVQLDMRSRGDRRLFIDLTYDLAKSHPMWHPGFRLYWNELLDPRRNPYWRAREAAFFAVRCGRRVVARGGVVAPGAIPQHTGAATLVMPDFVADAAASGALFDALFAQARSYGAGKLIGPMNPDIHHDIGIQVDGFAHRNAVFMGYQPPYYSEHIVAAGFEPLADFEAWQLDTRRSAPDPQLEKLARRVERSGRLRIRAADPKRFDDELLVFHRLYSESFADHWGFVPPTWEEFTFIASDLRHVLRRGMALVAELDGEPVGFVLAMPDLHAIVPRHARGRLSPWVLARTLWRWRSLADVRVMLAGVLPAHRRLGVHLPLFWRLRSVLPDLGIPRAEISWVLRDNGPMRRALPLLGARPAKTYRLYARRLSP
jgi:hypothetical protein